MVKKSKQAFPSPTIIAAPDSTTLPVPIATTWLWTIIATGVFFVLQIIGLLHHEPWRDEYQAFQIALNSHSWQDLIHNIRYEGHPVTWFALLYTLTFFTHNIFYMQLLHIIIATTGICVFFKYGPFTYIEKIIICLGYFLFFEYAQISREYVIGVCALISIAAIAGELYYKKKQRNEPIKPSLFYAWAMALVILANSSVYGMVLSGAMSVWIVTLLWDERQQLTRDRPLQISVFLSMLMVVLGWVLAYMAIKPLPGNSYPILKPESLFDSLRWQFILTHIFITYVPFPQWGTVGCWNTSMFVSDIHDMVAGAGLLVIGLILIGFIKKPRILLLYITGLLVLLAVMYYTYTVWQRYTGHAYMLWLICMWMGRYVAPSKTFIPRIPVRVANILSQYLFYSIIAIHAVVGIYFYYTDYTEPFSNISAAGKYIQDKKLNRFSLIGSSDFIIMPMNYYTGQPIYTSERNDTARYMIWDNKKSNQHLSFAAIVKNLLVQLDKDKRDTAIMILSTRLTFINNGATVNFTEGNLDATHYMKFINQTDADCMQPDEVYYMYMAYKKK